MVGLEALEWQSTAEHCSTKFHLGHRHIWRKQTRFNNPSKNVIRFVAREKETSTTTLTRIYTFSFPSFPPSPPSPFLHISSPLHSLNYFPSPFFPSALPSALNVSLSPTLTPPFSLSPLSLLSCSRSSNLPAVFSSTLSATLPAVSTNCSSLCKES